MFGFLVFCLIIMLGLALVPGVSDTLKWQGVLFVGIPGCIAALITFIKLIGLRQD